MTGCPFCAKKVKLKSGVVLDSLPEAYLYLKLKKIDSLIEINKKYGIGKYRCDFYLPKYKTYIEVTSYSSNDYGYAKKIWPKYYAKILKKKNYVENVLKENFKFFQVKLNNKQIKSIKKNIT